MWCRIFLDLLRIILQNPMGQLRLVIRDEITVFISDSEKKLFPSIWISPISNNDLFLLDAIILLETFWEFAVLKKQNKSRTM